MAELSAKEMTRMNSFLSTAASQGVDKAISKHGEAVNAREAAALRTLSTAELKSLNAINAKITKASGLSAVADWSCGFLC